MPIPTAITDLSTNPASNSPTGNENPIEGDNHLRTAYAFIRQIYDGSTGIAYPTLADLANTSNAAQGDALIGTKRTATGAVATTVHDTLELLPFNVKEFGAVCDGVTDDTTAFQNAINAALASSVRKTILVPSGTCRITSSLNITDSALERHDGIKLIGEGRNKTIIDFRGSGKVFNIRGIPPSDGSGTQSGTYFFWGMEIAGMTIDGLNKSGTTDAFGIVGLWYSAFRDITVKRLRHCFVSEGDTTYNTNPDWSSTAFITVQNCQVERITGFGLFNSVSQAAPGWQFKDCNFVFCREGGVLMSSASFEANGCSFSGCGWEHETDTPLAGSSGVRLTGAVTSTSKNRLSRCEFDTNFSAHLDVAYAGSLTVESCRFIYNDRYGYGAVCPTGAGVRFAPFDPANAVREALFANNLFRLDSGPTVGTPTCFQWVNTANVQNVRIQDSTFADNNGSLSFTKFTGHTASNRWAVHNYQADQRDLSDLTAVIPGRPLAEYIGTITGTPNGATVETIRPFGTQDSVNGQVFGSTLYNTGTGVFTCPVAGYYTVDVVVAVVGALTSDYHVFRLYKSGVFQVEWGGAGHGGSRTWYVSGPRRVFCNAGDTLDIREIFSPARVITGSYSYLRIALEQ